MATKHDIAQRLSQYRSVLYKLKALGFVRVFSDNLGDALEISPALVRKDFSTFSLTGAKRGGYRIDDLLDKLNRLLGKDKVQRIIIVGCGKIGQALMTYSGFTREGIQVVAGFDSNAAVIAPQASLPIYDVKELKMFVKREGIRIAIVAVPDNSASHVFDLLRAAEIKGILNFAPVPLKSVEGCVVRNINIGLELENLFYLVRFAGKHPPAPVNRPV
ncbi:MAG: redox-sensing transcriptional repressor Rex [Kiritimatiellaeota bacterium]|nr:redox-sensing transcriptional repressor Rex [Kiritimatiellota bacterium]